jgi:membrane protease YdiL (CAAX protease family)
LIALLCFILGIWLWDHYFGNDAGYAPGTEEIALIRIDRDMQLAEAMAADPALLRWLAHARTPDDALEVGIVSLEALLAENALGPTGAHAYAALLSTRDATPVDDYLQKMPFPSGDPDSPTWWNLKIASGKFEFPLNDRTATLRTRAILVGSIIWGLGLVGLAFLPAALRCLAGAFRTKPKGYSTGWIPSLGLMVFLLATLAGIGFTMMMEFGVMATGGMPPYALLAMDTAARLLPALIALSLLFRRPSHAVRTLGLNGHVHPPVILGLFALLVLIDQPLRWALGGFTAADPTGGLSFADSGIYGLVLPIVSVCVVAPIAEEILYRGVLHRSLSNRMGVLAAAVISSVVFAALHFYDFYGLASVAAFGFVCALAYQSTGSLIDVIALHMLYNASITLPEWTIYHAPI